MGEQYVIKIFNANSTEIIDNEIKLLNQIQSLKIAKIVERFSINKQEALLYQQIDGKSLVEPTLDEIKQIGDFLQTLHSLTKAKSNTNRALYTKERLKTLIDQADSIALLTHFKNIRCRLQKDGIIHGDLFVDNAKFRDGELLAVFDFCDACVGDFLFDVAVVAISWCYEKDILNNTKVVALLKSYKSPLSLEEFKPYIHYALLYYTTSRYIHKREYKSLLKRLDSL